MIWVSRLFLYQVMAIELQPHCSTEGGDAGGDNLRGRNHSYKTW